MNAGESAPAIVGRIKEFVSRTHAALPDTRIYYVSINKAPQKRDRWNVVEQVNADVKALLGGRSAAAAKTASKAEPTKLASFAATRALEDV